MSPSLCVNSEERAAVTDALRLGSAQGSWRSVEPAWRDTGAAIIGDGRKARAGDTDGIDHDSSRKDAGKECVQGAALVTEVSASIVVVMRLV
jgi:hypothetical protein